VTDRDQGPKDIDTGERMAVLAGATADAMKLKGQGEHETEKGAEQKVDPDHVTMVIENWPKPAKMGAEQMMEQYGPPNEATPTKLFWYRNGPWKRTELTSDEVVHNFPSPHTDFLTQYIDYRVPVEMYDEIGRYDGSCLVDRTTGEAAARCDSEAANFLTLNLMHDIVTGKTNVEDAREIYAENMVAFTMGRPTPYCERFEFEVPEGGTEDPDEAVIGAGAVVRQTAGKLKDAVTGGREADAPREP